jgi:hypothetical protein
MYNNAIMQQIAKMGLYEEIEITEDVRLLIEQNNKIVYKNNYYNDRTIDLYCPECKQKTTFQPSQEMTSNRFYGNSLDHLDEKQTSLIVFHYRCARETSHCFYVQLLCIRSKLIKIGQYPSRADIDYPELNKFSKFCPMKNYLK